LSSPPLVPSFFVLRSLCLSHLSPFLSLLSTPPTPTNSLAFPLLGLPFFLAAFFLAFGNLCRVIVRNAGFFGHIGINFWRLYTVVNLRQRGCVEVNYRSSFPSKIPGSHPDPPFIPFSRRSSRIVAGNCSLESSLWPLDRPPVAGLFGEGADLF